MSRQGLRRHDGLRGRGLFRGGHSPDTRGWLAEEYLRNEPELDRGRRPSGREGLVELLSAWERSGRALTEGAIRAGLQGLRLDRDSLAECVNFHERSYQRNRIYRTPGYELLVLCWRSGQRSPIHDHGRSTCGVLILEGVATETSFAASPCGRLVPSRSRRIESRSVVVCAAATSISSRTWKPPAST